MDINYFSKVRILDGGMGQHLLSKGLKTKGSLWSATALIDEKYHKLVIDSHLDFIKAGAEVIITNNFSARKTRMIQNKVEKHFAYANTKAGELAFKAKEISKKKIIIGGSLPPQNDTYVLDSRDKNIIEKNFYEQGVLLKPFVDFFYLDVLSSSKECKIAINICEKLDLPVLVGLHVKKNGKLPSKENIAEVFEKCKNKNLLGIILACTSPEIIENTVDEIKELKQLNEIPNDIVIRARGETVPNEGKNNQNNFEFEYDSEDVEIKDTYESEQKSKYDMPPSSDSEDYDDIEDEDIDDI